MTCSFCCVVVSLPAALTLVVLDGEGAERPLERGRRGLEESVFDINAGDWKE